MTFLEDEDIKNIEISDYIISDIRLDGINIDNCCFKNVQFIDCTLENLIISNSNFRNCLFVNCNIASIINSSFISCKLNGLNTSSLSIIKRSKFLGCDLQSSNIVNCTIKDTLFEECRFDDGKFYKCVFTNSEITNCRMMNFENYRTSLAGIDLSGCLIDGARFNVEDLKGAKCSMEQAIGIMIKLEIMVVE